MNKPELFDDGFRATYCPESNKLHLYVGRVPRDEYEALRAEGWTSTPKQSEAGQGEFAATWTPERRDTAISYAGIIEDEDAGPDERAADRAERFGGYLGKRLGEAEGHADRYEGQPAAHGFQNQDRAERAAARHDRIADRAGDAWGKAEYWQRRTAGVIAHALYVSSPSVRMGRIKTLEAELRKMESSLADYARRFELWGKIAAESDPEKQTALALRFAGGNGDYFTKYRHPKGPGHVSSYQEEHGSSLYDLLSDERHPISGAEACALYFAAHSAPATETDWTRHLNLRLAYENQMLEAQGGRAAFVEMIPGGFIGSHQIQKVNKSVATGRVVSVTVAVPAHGRDRWGNQVENAPEFHLRVIKTERLPENAYQPPTDEDKTSLDAKKKAEKAKAPKKPACPLINPTDEDAERLQEIWNENARLDLERRKARNGYAEDYKPSAVLRITQASYSAHSKGTYCSAGTRQVFAGGMECDNYYNAAEKMRAKYGLPVCQVRRTSGGSYQASRVIVITDKPQKPLLASVWAQVKSEVPA